MLTITCVVDRETISTALQGEHGLSFWIESEGEVVLFDTGQSAVVLMNNLKELDLPIEKIKAVALSHAHYDHTGGLAALLEKRPGLRVHAHHSLFQPRFKQLQSGYRSIGLGMSQMDLQNKADLRLSSDPVELLPGLWTSGEITERPESMGTSPYLMAKDERGEWIPDPHLDDLSLVYMNETQGLTLICGCCHAGILNTLAHVKRVFNRQITEVIGGIHLKNASEIEIAHVIEVLLITYPDTNFYLNHCTGDLAFTSINRVFVGRVKNFPVGMRLSFA
jgi:7,8-dihydropterin-6-yl-methyl-4-(beta-D-ribofuranosyl)aminobenzene 5'-phosphate synthase